MTDATGVIGVRAVVATLLVSAGCLAGCADDSPPDPGPADAGGQRLPSETQTLVQGESDASDTASYRADLARINAAKPPKRRKPADPEELLKHGKKIKVGHGYVYMPRHREPFPTATSALEGCDTTTSDGVVIPQPPGITAKRIGPDKLRVTYEIGGGDEKCHAEFLEVVADILDDGLSGYGKRLPISDERSGQFVFALGPVTDADILIAGSATSFTARGRSSRSTMIRIR